MRARVSELAKLARDTRELALHHVQKVLPAKSAANRILEYLRLNEGREVPGEEIDVVSAISEYPRRIREWRVEFGWRITYNKARDTYTLQGNEPEAEKAELWRTVNKIRRSDAAARDKMLALFLAFPGEVVATAQLRYVTDGKDMRRVRELRTELGYRIMTRHTGRPDLKSGHYVLADVAPVEPHDRHVEPEVIARVLRRDDNRCRKCGWRFADAQPGDPRQYIEVHHVLWHSEGGEGDDDNLITLCNVDHDVVHRDKLKGDDFWRWLKKER